jgi:hypothetical protein
MVVGISPCNLLKESSNILKDDEKIEKSVNISPCNEDTFPMQWELLLYMADKI